MKVRLASKADISTYEGLWRESYYIADNEAARRVDPR